MFALCAHPVAEPTVWLCRICVPTRMAQDQRSIWTVDELERLPEHGNRYEILHGELLVTTRDAVTWTPDAALPWMVITADKLFGPAPASG